jgi:hypothetical protein
LGELGVAPENIIFLGYGDQTQLLYSFSAVPLHKSLLPQ